MCRGVKPFVRRVTHLTVTQTVAVTVSKQYLLLSLIVAGDISPNPGPQTNYYCQVCEGQIIPGDVRTFCSYCQNWIHANCTNNWMCKLCSDSAPAGNVYMFPAVLNGESQNPDWPAAQTWNASSCQDIIGVDYLSDVSSTESSQASNSFLNLSENNSYSDETLEDCFQEVKLKRLEHPQNFSYCSFKHQQHKTKILRSRAFIKGEYSRFSRLFRN